MSSLGQMNIICHGVCQGRRHWCMLLSGIIIESLTGSLARSLARGPGTSNPSKSEGGSKGCNRNICEATSFKTSENTLFRSTCFFPITIYQQSDSEKIPITMNIDVIYLRTIKHQANRVRKYSISLYKIKHKENALG